MCCFSSKVNLVSGTKIFARGNNDSQFLVYQMTYAAKQELAMVLPLPIATGTGQDDVTFINLENYPLFFDHIQRGFPAARSVAMAGNDLSLPNLKLHSVGMYDASFVPSLADFKRLDRRFQIPPNVWLKLPNYRDYGFAVFKLKPASGPREVHPMAFIFPRRDVNLLYFPTIHIHDGQIHPHAEFDHKLYCQVDECMIEHMTQWRRSSRPAGDFMKMDVTQGIVQPDVSVWQFTLEGQFQNMDTLVGKGGAVPSRAYPISTRRLAIQATGVIN